MELKNYYIKRVTSNRIATLEEEIQTLSNTNKLLEDDLLNYMQNKAFDKQIRFEIIGIHYISVLIDKIISESDFNTLLGDLIENAIIATSHSSIKQICLDIGCLNEYYYINIFDSGIEFPINVLYYFEKQRITTYKNSNGSGIGLMSTDEFLRKYSASFVLSEYDDKGKFTKSINIRFDHQQEHRILSYHHINLSNSLKQTNWITSPL